MLTTYASMFYLNSKDPVQVCIHSADPTDDGSAARIGSPLACTFDAAVIGEPDRRYLSENVEFTLVADANITHISLYDAANNCLHRKAVTVPRSLLAGDKYVLSTDTIYTMS